MSRIGASANAETGSRASTEPASSLRPSGFDPARRVLLTKLYLSGMPFRLIAKEYGGTPQGIRSNVRRLREYGLLPARPQPQRGQWA